MAASYPKPTDGHPVIQLKDTDKSLPSDVQTQNNTRYAYFKTIAHGGKCLIQACKDLHLGRTVCYKTLLPEIGDDPLEQTRFLREARVTAMLQHPNTAPVYELGRDTKGRYYFTMKLVVGSTLREVLDKLRANEKEAVEAWDLDRLIDVLLQVAQALDYAHNHGVVHRDIKPANIVAGPYGEVLLLDWGLAKVWNQTSTPNSTHLEVLEEQEDKSLTSQGPLQATPLYMSPEQVTGSNDINHLTDIYSLGAVLFEVLTLQHLAWGDTLEEMMEHTQNWRPVTPRLVSPDREVPTALETLCLRCTQKQPEHRIQSVREVIIDLLMWRRLRDAARPL